MTGYGTKFGRKKEEVIVALLTTRTVEKAARVVDISPRTLLRWMKEPEFDAAYRAAKRAAFGQSIARLHHLSSAAVTTLGKVMLEPGTPPATRVRAADSILDHTTKATEIEGLRPLNRTGTRRRSLSATVMITRTLARRLERLEAYLAPPSDEPAMVIRMTCVGEEDRIIEVRRDNTADRRRQPWSPRRALERWR